jgi:hypothetical protein
MRRKQLKVVRLIEPELCLECRFAQMASVELKDGSVQRMVHCKRLDCDNWDYATAETAKGVYSDGEAA